jgi:hypothetical protein
MQLIEWKFKILAWLAPGLIAEVDRLRWMTEALHDLHICPIPYNDLSLQTAFANVREYEPALLEGKATIQDRQASLIEALRRLN